MPSPSACEGHDSGAPLEQPLDPVEQLVEAEREVRLDGLVFEDAGYHGTR